VVVSEKDVDVVVKELDSALGWENLERQGVNRPQIAGLLVEAPYLTEVGQAHGLTVTDAQIVEMVKKQVGLVRGTLDGDISPRYSNKAQTWLTQTDPRLEAGNNPFGGGLQQAPQQQQQDPQQQAPQQGGQQQAPQQQGGGQQQAPQQQQQPQQQVPQQGGQQPADSGQTDGQGQTGQGDGAAGEGGQGAEQPETSGRSGRADPPGRRRNRGTAVVQSFSPGVNTVQSSGPWPS